MSLEKLKAKQLCFYMECNGFQKALYCEEGMEFQDFVLFVKREIALLDLSVTDTIKCLEMFQIWILQHFGVVLDVYPESNHSSR